MLSRRLRLQQFSGFRPGAIAHYVTLRRPLISEKRKEPSSVFAESATDSRHVPAPKIAGDRSKQPRSLEGELRRRGDSVGNSSHSPWESRREPGFFSPTTTGFFDGYRNQSEPPAGPTGSFNGGHENGLATVLSIRGLSQSILESDFYRLAPRGQHLDGWVGGIQEVNQARHPTTHEPIGHYFLFFASNVAALAYANNLQRLHSMSQAALARREGGSLPPTGENTVDGHALRQYALAPPGVPLHTNIYTRQEVGKVINKMKQEQSAKAKLFTGRSRDPETWAQIGDAVTVLNKLKALDAKGIADDADPGRHLVCLRLEGAERTPQAIRAAIAIDGQQRNLPWHLDQKSEAVQPVRLLNRMLKLNWGSQKAKVGAAMDAERRAQETFSRFTIRFAEEAEVGRFVRSWHKRTLPGDWADRATIVNAMAMPRHSFY